MQHFPVYLIVIFLAGPVTARNYPDWSNNDGLSHPRFSVERLNLSLAHRHGNRGRAWEENKGGNENYSHVNFSIGQDNLTQSHNQQDIFWGELNKTVSENYSQRSEKINSESENTFFLDHHGQNREIKRRENKKNGHSNFLLQKNASFIHKHTDTATAKLNKGTNENHRITHTNFHPHPYNSSYGHRHVGGHRHGSRGFRDVNKGGGDSGDVIKGDEGVVRNSEKEKLTVLDAGTGIQYNPYSKHQPGRHVCTRNSDKAIKTRQSYCKPTYKNYVIRCQGNQICKGVRLVYETHYKDVVTTKNANEILYACCPGWIQVTNRSHGCNKASCSKPCLNGGKCVKPNLCACLKGFAGQQCEIPIDPLECRKPCLNGGKCIQKDICSCTKGFDGPQCENDLKIPQCIRGCENGGTCIQDNTCQCLAGFTGRRCEKDIDECREQKPCDQICYNSPGSYNCQCKEDFVLQKDGQTCRKEDDNGDGGIEAKDLEFEMLDKRLLKLETMMDESHKNDISKDELKSVYKDINIISEDMHNLKNKIIDVENYKNDMHIFKTKLSTIEKKAEKVDDLMLKYDRMKKCAFYNKICM